MGGRHFGDARKLDVGVDLAVDGLGGPGDGEGGKFRLGIVRRQRLYVRQSLRNGVGVSNHATAFTPLAEAVGSRLNTGLLLKNMSVCPCMPNADDDVESVARRRTDPGT